MGPDTASVEGIRGRSRSPATAGWGHYQSNVRATGGLVNSQVPLLGPQRLGGKVNIERGESPEGEKHQSEISRELGIE